MQRVDVLGDDGTHQAALLERRDRTVPRVRLGVAEEPNSLPVEAPDALRIAAKGID